MNLQYLPGYDFLKPHLRDMLAKMQPDKIQSELFQIGMLLRIAYGTMRLILGLALLKLIDVQISDILYKLTGFELVEGSSNYLFNTINSFLIAHPISITYFLSAYFIFWGTIEIVLSVSLLRHKLWAFPITLWLIGFFMAYVVFRYTQTNSPFLIGIFFVDAILFWLIRNEYLRMKAHLLPNPETPTSKA